MKIASRGGVFRVIAMACLLSGLVCAEEVEPEPVDLKALAKGASEGDAEAMYQLGVVYEQGIELPPNPSRAMEWFTLAADEGHPIAQYRAGRVYLAKGNLPKAKELLMESARQGHIRAQYTLGLMYETATGTNRDHRQAVFWYREAAREGDKDAQYNLANHLTHGKGVDQDPAEAQRWLTASAEQGHVDAQKKLAFSHIEGDGVAMNLVHGHAWFGVMAEGGDFAASNLMRTLEKSMNEEQIGRAENLTMNFLEVIADHTNADGNASNRSPASESN